MSAIDERQIQRVLKSPDQLEAIAVAAAKAANILDEGRKSKKEYEAITAIADAFDVLYF